MTHSFLVSGTSLGLLAGEHGNNIFGYLSKDGGFDSFSHTAIEIVY